MTANPEQPATNRALARRVWGVTLLALFAGWLVYAFGPLPPTFAVGACLTGYWSDTANATTLTGTACSEPHDYRVTGLADDWESCPTGTFGRVPYSAPRFGGSAHYMCIVRTP